VFLVPVFFVVVRRYFPGKPMPQDEAQGVGHD